MKNISLKKPIAWCCIAICLFCQYPTVGLMAKNTSDSLKAAEVEDYIKELYEAQSNRDINWIRERLEDDALEDWAINLSKIYYDDLGFQKYENIQVKAYPVSDEDYFVAYTAYDMVIDWDGETLSLPGFITMLVKQNGNSQWRIASPDNLPDELADEIRKQSLSDEIVDMYNAITKEYNDILVSTPELPYWLDDVNSQIVHWVGSWLASEAYREKGAWDYLFGEEDGLLTTSPDVRKDNSYIVQKGDCLWSIAQRELGDGKHWGKLYEANRDVIGENPDLLWIGIELNLEAD